MRGDSLAGCYLKNQHDFIHELFHDVNQTLLTTNEHVKNSLSALTT